MKSRFTDTQIIAILNQAKAGASTQKLCCEHGISNATFYKWRQKFRDAGLKSNTSAELPVNQSSKTCSLDQSHVKKDGSKP